MVKLLTARERELSQWEYAHVHARDPRKLALPEVRGVCAHVWQLCRLPAKPPSVVSIDRTSSEYIRGAVAYVQHGTAAMVLQQACGTAVILHELAHTLTDDPLDELELRPMQEREMHGRLWLTNYLWLLDRLMGPAFNTFHLRGTMPAVLEPATLPYHPVIWGVPRPNL